MEANEGNQPNSAGLMRQKGKQNVKLTRGTSRTRLVFWDKRGKQKGCRRGNSRTRLWGESDSGHGKALGYNNTRDALTKHVADEDKTAVANRDGSSFSQTFGQRADHGVAS